MTSRRRRVVALPESPARPQRFAAHGRPFAATLPDAVLATAVALGVRAGRNETGGVILGRYAPAHDCAEIHELLPPPAGSHATPTSFYRGTDGLFALLQDRWRAGIYYLGEWHSHPFAAPTPSAADIAQIQSIATDPRYRCPEPLLLILGADLRKAPRIGVHVCPRGGRLLHLQPDRMTEPV